MQKKMGNNQQRFGGQNTAATAAPVQNEDLAVISSNSSFSPTQMLKEMRDFRVAQRRVSQGKKRGGT